MKLSLNEKREEILSIIYCIYYSYGSSQSILKEINPEYLLGASMGNPARGKGHEEKGLTNAKAGSGLRGPPGFSGVSTPKTRVCLLCCVMLSTHSSDINRGLSPCPTFFWKKLIQSFQIVSLLGIIRVFQSNPSDGFLACLTGLSRLLQLHM